MARPTYKGRFHWDLPDAESDEDHGSRHSREVVAESSHHTHQHKAERERELTGRMWTFETSTTTPSDTLPPPRPYFLVLLKEFQHLGTNHSNNEAGDHSHSNHHQEKAGNVSVFNNWMASKSI